MKTRNLLLIILIFVILLAAYWPILGWFFARDDFGFLPHLPTTIQNLSAIFIPPQNWFFRPLSQQFYFWLNTQIWGLNPLGFRLVGIALLTANTYFVYRLIKRFANWKVALVGVVFYGLNTLHLFEIGWIAAHYQTISTFFFLSTVLLATSDKPKRRLLSYLTLILAFLSSEMSVFSAPIIILISLVGAIHESPLQVLKRNTWYIALTMLYLFFYFLYVHLPGGSVYGRFIDPLALLKTLGKYILYPFVAGFDRSNIFGITNILLATRDLIILGVAIYSTVKKTWNKKLIILGATWFLITVSIFTVLSNHTFAYLDAIPSIGLTLIIAASWTSLINKPRHYAIMLILLVLTSFGALLTAQKTDPDLKWLNEHQLASKAYLTSFTVPASKEVILNQNNSPLMEATYFGSLINAFFKDQNLTVTLTNTK